MNSLNLESITKKERKARVAKSSAKEKILMAALEQFNALGFNGSSTTEIASRVGVTQPLLHYHFKTKSALFEACVVYALKNLEIWQVKRFLPFFVRELMESGERTDLIRTYIALHTELPNVQEIRTLLNLPINSIW